MTTQQKFTRLHRQIILKLKGEIHKHGYYENLGRGEIRLFNDELDKTDLTYSEKYSLEKKLIEAIDNL